MQELGLVDGCKGREGSVAMEGFMACRETRQAKFDESDLVWLATRAIRTSYRERLGGKVREADLKGPLLLQLYNHTTRHGVS